MPGHSCTDFKSYQLAYECAYGITHRHSHLGSERGTNGISHRSPYFGSDPRSYCRLCRHLLRYMPIPWLQPSYR